EGVPRDGGAEGAGERDFDDVRLRFRGRHRAVAHADPPGPRRNVTGERQGSQSDAQNRAGQPPRCRSCDPPASRVASAQYRPPTKYRCSLRDANGQEERRRFGSVTAGDVEAAEVFGTDLDRLTFRWVESARLRLVAHDVVVVEIRAGHQAIRPW